MTMRLIDANYVLAHLKPYELSDEEWSVTGGTALRLIHTAINQAPTIDAKPVVRCKDCIHYDMGVCLKIYSDGNAHPDAWQPRKLEDFCSYGERKDNDNG